jgi:hypothetical protein
MRNVYRILVIKPEGRDNLEDLMSCLICNIGHRVLKKYIHMKVILQTMRQRKKYKGQKCLYQ